MIREVYNINTIKQETRKKTAHLILHELKRYTVYKLQVVTSAHATLTPWCTDSKLQAIEIFLRLASGKEDGEESVLQLADTETKV